MAAARETQETVSSGSETKSGNKTDSGAEFRDATEAASNPAKPDGETRPPAEDRAGPATSLPSAEPPKTNAGSEPSLGKTLEATRERRGVSRADVALETRIPAHYLEMIESSDYGLISDQLYLMPFLRRYAAFLNLDGEEIAMRFVREVQRAENAAGPRMSEPLALHDRNRTPWGRVAMVIIVLSAIVVLYIIASEHHRGEFGLHQSPPATPTAPSATIPPAAAIAPMSAFVPHAAAPAQLPETTVIGGPAAPAATGPRKAPPQHATSSIGTHNE
ncbi:MAG: helix-turn-helix domain-containing protein [Candidatus Binataceae bacterium]